MNWEIVRYALYVFYFVVMILLIVQGSRFLGGNQSSTPMVYLVFFGVTNLLCTVYWLTHNLMLEGIRLPFTAAEIAENGSLLLLGTVLKAAFPEREPTRHGLVCAAAVFAAANTALWIGWNGEWLKDLVGFPVLFYLVLCCLRALRSSGAMSKTEWALLGFGSAALLLLEGAAFFLPASFMPWTDGAGYAIILLGNGLFLLKTVSALRRRGDRTALSIAVSFTAWTIIGVYMSAEPVYFLTEFMETVSFLLLLPSIRVSMRTEEPESAELPEGR